jgi:hypothetical protein
MNHEKHGQADERIIGYWRDWFQRHVATPQDGPFAPATALTRRRWSRSCSKVMA